MQVIIELLLDEVIDEFVDAHAAGRTHVFGSQFHFRLALEDRFFDVNRDRTDHAVTDVGQLLVLIEELLDRSTDRLAVCRLMGTALDGVLAVDEGEILLVRLVGMGQRDLDIFAFDMDDGVERIDRHILRQQVQ